MREEHLEGVHAIECTSYEFPWTLAIFRDCLKAGYSCWVMEDPEHGGVAGYGILSRGPGEAHILNVCVDPIRRRLGFGRLLLRHLLGAAEEHGAAEVFLEVRPSNREALALYLHDGFREVGRRRDYYPAAGGREDALVLARRL